MSPQAWQAGPQSRWFQTSVTCSELILRQIGELVDTQREAQVPGIGRPDGRNVGLEVPQTHRFLVDAIVHLAVVGREMVPQYHIVRRRVSWPAATKNAAAMPELFMSKVGYKMKTAKRSGA